MVREDGRTIGGSAARPWGDAKPGLDPLRNEGGRREASGGWLYNADQQPSPSRAARAFAALRPSFGRGRRRARRRWNGFVSRVTPPLSRCARVRCAPPFRWKGEEKRGAW
ncbi:MAG: hypothetical protein OJF61_002477 [Rhodanobacteraceae bacterium]|nr:MAG: hypothetical protein OJF61_002477 [Rhodanobacteraceae bacterium]